MNILIIKLGATGDVVRTTTLLRVLPGTVSWITAAKNLSLFEGAPENVRCISWEQRERFQNRYYDLVINLEDTLAVARFVETVKFQQLFGAHASASGSLSYTEDARGWFDLSLISRFGRERADELKLQNRRTYQELVFDGLGYEFANEPYYLPPPQETYFTGDVAIANVAGPVWPMKNWAYYNELKSRLEGQGLVVNFLPERATLTEHLCDVRNHRCLVGGDSLPMHFALGTNTPCITLFNCTSPWEICDYGLQQKLISPLLEEFFYQRGLDKRATTAISVEEVLAATMEQLQPRVETAHAQLQK